MLCTKHYYKTVARLNFRSSITFWKKIVERTWCMLLACLSFPSAFLLLSFLYLLSWMGHFTWALFRRKSWFTLTTFLETFENIFDSILVHLIPLYTYIFLFRFCFSCLTKQMTLTTAPQGSVGSFRATLLHCSAIISSTSLQIWCFCLASAIQTLLL